MTISIIIPTINEETFVSRTIDHLLTKASEPSSLEIIVVDAGSTDQTLKSIEELPVTTFSKPDFRLKKSASLNFGIQKAQGEVVMFLDADTLLPDSFDRLIKEKLKDEKYVGGAFNMKFDRSNWSLKTISFINYVRYHIWKTFYGDQAIFCRREVAIKSGGFSDTLMEAAFFCRAIQKHGKLAIINDYVISSSRRFYENGIFKVTWFDIWMWIRFLLGLDLKSYREKYWEINVENG